jgi:hypothetical protein
MEIITLKIMNNRIIILLIYCLFTINAFADLDPAAEFIEEMNEPWYDKQLDKVAIVNGKKCLSRFHDIENNPICNKEVMVFINKIRQAAINDDPKALADTLDFPVHFRDSKFGYLTIKYKKEFINKYYRKLITKQVRKLLSELKLADVHVMNQDNMYSAIEVMLTPLERLHSVPEYQPEYVGATSRGEYEEDTYKLILKKAKEKRLFGFSCFRNSHGIKFIEEMNEPWYEKQLDSIDIIDGKTCLSRFSDDGKTICNKDMLILLNKFKQAAIDDDPEALANIIDFPISFSAKGGADVTVNSKKQFINKYYRKFMNEYARNLLSEVRLSDARHTYSSGIGILFPLATVASYGKHRVNLKLGSLSEIDEGTYQDLLKEREEEEERKKPGWVPDYGRGY